MFETEPPRDSIDRVAGLSHPEFIRRYVMPMRPVVLTDATAHWRALGLWTPEFFRDRHGSVEVVIDKKTWTLRDYMEALLASTPESPAPYLRNVLLEKWLPERMGDISPLPRCTAPNWLDSKLFPSGESLRTLEIYIGGAGARFPVLHYDGLHTHAWLMQIYGSKRYVVYPPEQAPYVYPKAGIEANKSSIADLEHPDLSMFPLFAKATPTIFDLHPGETLFVPSGWWHTVKILSPSITISINAANRPNWSAFVRDFVGSKRASRPAALCVALNVYLTALGWSETAIGSLTGWSQVL
jgi:hypothetical protein